MKFIHMADLHLGKCLLETPLLEEQKAFLQELLALAVREAADALILAGDIYDRSVPPADAVEALNAFLESAHRAGLPILAVSGNHDSPERLNFLSGVLADQGVHIAGLYRGTVPRVTLRDQWGPVHVYLLPFLKPAFVRQALGGEIPDTDTAVRAALSGLPENPQERNVLVAHQFVCAAGAAPETCDSETLSVGGSDQVDVSAFDGFDYVALGHLHRAQRMGRDTVRYAGSPLKYSLSEAAHAKSVTLVTLSEKGQVDIRLLPVTPLRDLRRIRGELEELLTAGRGETAGRDDYIWAVLTGDPGLDPAERLRLVYPRLLHVELAPPEGESREESSLPDGPRKDESALFHEFFQSVCGRPLTPEQSALVEDVVARLRERETKE